MTKHKSLLLSTRITHPSLKSLKHFFLSFSFPLGLGLIFSYPINAQVANYGRSPTLNILTDPSGNGGSSYLFSPADGLTCPTPGFSIGAYGGAGNDWSNDYTTYNSSGSGINNYGVAAGITVPLGGDFSNYCNDYAKSVADRHKMETEAIRRNSELSLLRQCYWLVQNKINTDQTAFTAEDGAFSSLKACNDYKFKPRQGGTNSSNGDNQQTTETSQDLTPTPMTEITPPPSSSLIIQKQPR
jgi:hypothetical protein